jgi:hypothetical protein
MKKLLMLVLAIFLSGCAVQVKTYQKPNTDIAKYETWCWLEGCEVTYQGPEEYYNEEALATVSDAIEEQMAKKGYIRNDDEQDLLVNFYLIVEMKEQQVVEPPYDGLQMEMRWLPEVCPEYIHYLKGSLVIDVIDRQASELLWRVNAIKYLDIYPAMDQNAIKSAVERAMKRLPDREYK